MSAYTVETALPVSLTEVLASLETHLIGEALKEADGNCAEAAKLLGINRTTLVEKRRRYGARIKGKGAPLRAPAVKGS